MTFAFLHTDLTEIYILAAIIVALLVAVVLALLWRLYRKIRPKR